MRKSAWLLAIALLAGACSHNPYLDASLLVIREKIVRGLKRNWALLMPRRPDFSVERSGPTIELRGERQGHRYLI
jgi:hypothetical protein